MTVILKNYTLMEHNYHLTFTRAGYIMATFAWLMIITRPGVAQKIPETGITRSLSVNSSGRVADAEHYSVADITVLNVSGKITDAVSKEPIPGVSVLEKGTSNGTITDVDGAYTLTLKSETPVLVFSFVGYATREVPVNGQQTIDVLMEEDRNQLQEVVVVGFGTEKRVNLSGAVDQVDSRVLESRPIANIAQGLQGMIPNLNIQFGSGSPGQAASVNIRGITSLNGGDPLILIDGVPSDAAELNRLPPTDVATMSVIKDASAAAIYGARAAFGVILITTKSGDAPGAHIKYMNNITWNKATVMPDMVTDPYIFSRLLELSTDNTPWDNVNYSDQYYAYAKQRSDDPSVPGVRVNPASPDQWEYMGNRDWTKYFLSDYTFSQSHNLSINGTSDNQAVKYYVSGAYNRQNGPLTIAKDYFDLYGLRSKVTFDLYPWLMIGNNTFITRTVRQSPRQLNTFDLYNLFPTDWDKNPDGTWANTAAGKLAGSIADGGNNTDAYNTIQSQFNLRISLFKKLLTLNADYTFRRKDEDYKSYSTVYKVGYGPDDVRDQGTNSIYRGASADNYNVLNLYGTLSKQLNRNSITFVAGYNQEEYHYEWFNAANSSLVSPSFPTLALATGINTTGESITSWAVRGAFYRLNYIYNDRYIMEFNGRYDGSSRFPKDKRFGFFPSASAAWRIDQEDFMRAFPVVSQLKLRASYGLLGNQSVADFGYIPTMNAYQANYLVNGQRPYAVTSPGEVSANYTWEKVRTLNFGIDAGVLNDRLSVNFDIFRRNTLDMITLGKDLPNVLGTSEPSENAADLQTKGWELSLNYHNDFMVQESPLYFSARVVLSDSHTYITRFENPTKSILQFYKGMELGEIWGLKSDGLFRNEEEIAALNETAIIPWGALSIVPGWPKYVDMDNTGSIDKGYTIGATKDISIIGNSLPRLRFGVDLNMNWKGFDLRMFFQGIGKRDYYPIDYLYWGPYQQPYGNIYKHQLDFYRPADDADLSKHSQSYIDAGLAKQNLDAKYPILQSWLADRNLGTRTDEAMGLAIPQTGYMLNAAYVRLKNLTIGYTLPARLTEKMHINKLRVFASGENITEWSELKKYYDPEAVNMNIYTNPGQSPSREGNGMSYPFQRSYSIGVNVNF